MTTHEWPPLRVEAWRDTYATLHLWTQIVGKIRLATTPLVNHWWNVPLYVSARGLTTSPMPYGERIFEIEFDFIEHALRIACSDGALTRLALRPQPVAQFYAALMAALHGVGIDVHIWPMPVEVDSPSSVIDTIVRFDEDRVHTAYDAPAANRFFRALVAIDDVFKQFRTGFVGKSSPVHFWWGAFDHAVTRFSGRRAPPREGADAIMAEGYSHEVISHGFWPGGKTVDASFYAYAAPAPAGLAEAKVEPADAYYSNELNEFLLPYEAVRTSTSPEAMLMRFLQSTYDVAADLAHWDRAALERTPPDARG